METHTCLKEKEFAEIQTTLKYISERLLTHVVEGDRVGGYRDRLLVMEECLKATKKEISTIKQGYWRACIASGIIGGMLGNLTPDLINVLIKLTTGG